MSDESEVLPDDYDPPMHERTYYQHKYQGTRAYIARRRGQDTLRVDRGPASYFIDNKKDGTLPLNDWEPCNEPRPILIAFASQIAFEADRVLCRVRGDYSGAVLLDWQRLNEDERLDFMNKGPKTSDKMRREMWEAVMGVIRRYAKA